MGGDKRMREIIQEADMNCNGRRLRNNKRNDERGEGDWEELEGILRNNGRGTKDGRQDNTTDNLGPKCPVYLPVYPV